MLFTICVFSQNTLKFIITNPVIENITINGLDNDHIGRYRFKVFNILGQEIPIIRSKNIVYVSKLKAGIYFLQVSRKEEYKTIKFIKQ